MMSYRNVHNIDNMHVIGRPTSEYLCPMGGTSLSQPTSSEADDKVKSAVALYKKELSKQEAKRHSKLKNKSS